MTSQRETLLNLIATHSFKLGDFTLASGQKSDYYIDCRTTTLHAEGGRLSGLVFYELIRERFPQAEAVGGLTMGADPLVSNTASASAWYALQQGQDPANPATKLLQGFLKPGAAVVIVDDVCTTGGSTITAIEAARESGMNVIGILCLVDREQGGRANIEAAAKGAPFISVFTASDVRAAHLALKDIR